MPDLPLISCLMVTAAREDRFRWIVASVADYCRQTHPHRELVMVLDQPAPADRQRLEEHVASLHRPDIRMVASPPGSTLGALRNLSMDAAGGDFICVWDDDDGHHPRRIELQLAHLRQTGAAAVCLSDCLHLFVEERRCYWVNWALTRYRGLPGTLLARRDHGLRYAASGRFAQKGEDTDLLERLMQTGATSSLAAPPFLYLYRFHGANTFQHQHHAMLAEKFCEGGAHLRGRQVEVHRCLQELDAGLDETMVVDRDGVAFRVSRDRQGPVTDEDASAFHRNALRLVPFGREAALASLPGVEEPVVVHRAMAEMVASCSPFATVEAHAHRICNDPRFPGLAAADVREALQDAADRGLLVSAAQVLQSGSPQAEGPTIRSIGVVTKGRPEALVRCLRGFEENLRRSGRSAGFTVVDSTPEPDAGDVRRAVSELREQTGATFVYQDRVGKTAFAHDLARAAGVDPRLAEFALLGLPGLDHDVGANRNAMILLHAGRTVFCVDDDMECDLRGPMDPVDAVAVTGEEAPVPVTLHRSFSLARAALAPLPGCVFDGHEGLLGRTVADALAGTPPGRIALGSCPPALLTSLLRRETRVIASFGGHYGDAGARYPAFFLWSGPTVRQQIAGGADDYRALVRSRQITRLTPWLVITGSSFSMCGHVALDCRTLLPPFFPNLRGEDHLFGQVLRACFDEALFAHVPQALAHSPWESRGPYDHLWDPAPNLQLLAVLGQCLDLAQGPAQIASSGERRLRMLGRCLQELALMPAQDFRQVVRERVNALAGRTLARNERLIEEASGAPEHWIADLRLHGEHLLQLLRNPDRDAPAEFLAGRTAADASALLQRSLDRYGRLLEVWPELFQAARSHPQFQIE